MDTVIDPRWPDKMRAAATLVCFAGALGMLWHVLKDFIIMDEELPLLLQEGGLLPFYLSLAAFVFGWMGLGWERRRFITIGAACAILSMGAAGTTALLGASALVALLIANREREEPMQYPAHAMLAGLFLGLATATTTLYAVVLGTGHWQPIFAGHMVVTAIAAIVGVVGTLFANRIYHPALPFVAASTLLIAGAFMGLGSLFAALALWQLIRSAREAEFLRTRLVRLGVRRQYA